MYYKESNKILQSIKSVKRVLITSHKEPDADSIGSVIAFHLSLKKIGVSSDLVCKDNVPEYLQFVPFLKKVKKVDFKDFNYGKYDLIIALDSSEWDQVVGSDLKNALPDKPIIVIDHHNSNKGYGEINLIDKRSTSVSEMVYKMLVDWKLDIDEGIATNLLTGIIGDTGSFRYPGIGSETFDIASKLMKAGADREKIILNLHFSTPFEELKYLAEILKEAEFDKKNKIVWAAISYEKYLKMGKPDGFGFAGAFFQVVKDTEIGIFMVEKEKGMVDVSFRARRNIDVSRISVSLGGGGHKRAAGVKLKGIKFKDAVEKVLETARKYTK